MPRDFDGILEEHQAVRNHAGVFDVSHMGRLTISGTEANRTLNRLFTRNIPQASEGRALYGFFCEEDGGCLDDAIAYRQSNSKTWLVVNAANRKTILDHLNDHLDKPSALKDHTHDTILLALQGPEAPHIAEEILSQGFPDKPYRCKFDDGTMVASTGYTGEPGGELWLPLEAGRKTFDTLLGSVQPCGLGARDSLRLEKGFPLHGHELSADIDPVTAGLDRFVDFDHDFLGRDALEQQRETGDQKIRGLRFSGRGRVEADAPVIRDGTRVGRVTSSGYSPVLETAIGLALVDSGLASGTTVAVRGKRAEREAELIQGPFL